MEILGAVLLGILPSIFWLSIVFWLDRRKPEPKFLVLKMFGWGMLIAFIILIIAQGIYLVLDPQKMGFLVGVIILSFLIDGFLEEGAKYAVLKDKVYKLRAFDEPIDGLVYGVTVAMGFAFFENILYILLQGPGVIVIRFVTSTLMHALAAGIIGYHFSLLKIKGIEKGRHFLALRGLALAVLLHGFYNFLVRVENQILSSSVVFLLTVLLFLSAVIWLWWKFRKLCRLVPREKLG